MSTARATRLLAEHGPNELPRDRGPSLLGRVLTQLRDPMILLLCGALVLVLAVSDHPDAVIIATVIVVNTAIGVTQDVRAQHAVDALTRMAAPLARAWRDGRLTELSATELVPGDLVQLDAGDVVPADVRLVDTAGVEVDESAMTGESVPVARGAGQDLLSGTALTRGRCVGTVVRTGPASALGQISALVSGRPRPTPLQLRLSRLSRQLVLVTGAVCLLVGVLALVQGESLTAAAILAVSLGVAAVPESLPAVVTISLALGAYRMARRHAVVRHLPAVETLGSVTVLATDKTGTVTSGILTARRLWTPDGECELSGTAYGMAGELTGTPAARAGAARLLRDAALCNDASLVPMEDEWRPVGDPFDVALLVAARRGGVTPESLRGWARTDETSFDSALGYARTVHEDAGGRTLEVVKGAPEKVLDLLPPGELVDEARDRTAELAADGFRVLAVVENRTWVGLVAVIDPPHPAAADVLRQCRSAGIRPVLVTGDHAATAEAVATELGILDEGHVADGDVVDRGEHVAQVESIDVYARIRPEQKVAIVDAWQSRGAVVAMTGDGINDAPALRRADIGVAMGGRGTEVARQAADLVLVDDDLSTLVEAVAEGRRIHTNIRTFLRYGLAGGLAEVAVLLAAPLLGLPVPLTPGMILWINLMTHGVPGVAFGGEPLDPLVMRRPSPAPGRSVLDRVLVKQIVFAGALVTAVSLAAGSWADLSGGDVRTAVFVTLGLAQLWLALALRAPRSGAWAAWRERGLEAAVALAATLQLAGVAVPGLRELLGTVPLGADGLLVTLVLSALPALVVRLSRRSKAAVGELTAPEGR
ncbi:MAG TPA: cation-transporting P-type ATPase [Nocardioides sp.]|uniref:cation-translocating P-type ATPase n=1 Tax=Nocardioides sp. TaxID=35761 RepID=UPI002E345438|nr:cation-transporting P-type ATPase [Nocardioides sp.]HEX5086394.1 cation-transporting P-type ATPase [Nocardioides sp.]